MEWTVDEIEARAAVCSTSLISAPLEIVRRVTLARERPARSGSSNLGGEAIDFMWGHHPAFGAPFLESGCTIIDERTNVHRPTTARPVQESPLAPGRELEHLATCRRAIGGQIDLSTVSQSTDRAGRQLGYPFSHFHDWSYPISTRASASQQTIRWPLEFFPTAWFWQELHRHSAAIPGTGGCT